MNGALALILAGGRGKRMGMLCDVKPKPALPFAGKFRVIDFSLSNCIHSRINDIGVITDYQRSYLAGYLNRWHMINARSANFRVLEPGDTHYLGTADAVFRNLDYVRARQVDAVLVLAGDHIYKMDYARMLASHRRTGADATVGVIPIPIEQAYRFGTVTVNSEDRITGFVEKSASPLSNLASMGIYVFSTDFLTRRLTADAQNPASGHDFGYSLLPQMVRQDRVYAYRFSGYWQDIGTVQAYYEANMELTREQPAFSLNSGTPVLTDGIDLPPAHVFKQATVINSLIGPGCVIKGRVENSVLSPGVCVEEQAVVKDSLVMENTSIGFHAVIQKSVLDESLDVGSYCRIGFGSLGTGQSDITVVGKGAVIPPHTAIGRNCKIKPRVRPADFAAVVVPYGATVDQVSAAGYSTA
jgi:glucose-1-phosphate adenylyltransferase